MVNDEIYHISLQHWVDQVEQNSPEYFSDDIITSWDSLVMHDSPKTSFKKLFLMEKDPLTELLKHVEHYCHTEAASIEKLADHFDLNIKDIIETIHAISHFIKGRVSTQLQQCKEIQQALGTTPSLKKSVAEKMARSFDVVSDTVSRHFNAFIWRLSQKYNFISWSSIFGDDVVEREIYSSRVHITIVPLILHMLAAITCLALSSIFHLFSCHCEKSHTILSRLDYGGIVILIGGSTIPPYIYQFYCGELWYFGLLYTIIIDSVCLLAFIGSLVPTFDQPKYRNIRAILFVIVGLASGLPGLHVVFFRDPFVSPPANVFLWALGGAVYISGAFIYAYRFPEKYFPGRF